MLVVGVVAIFFIPEVRVRLAPTTVVDVCPSSSVTDPVSLPSSPTVSTPPLSLVLQPPYYSLPFPSHSRQISLPAVFPSQIRSPSTLLSERIHPTAPFHSFHVSSPLLKNFACLLFLLRQLISLSYFRQGL